MATTTDTLFPHPASSRLWRKGLSAFELLIVGFILVFFYGTSFLSLILGIEDMADPANTATIRRFYIILYIFILAISVLNFRQNITTALASLSLLLLHAFLMASYLWSVEPAATFRASVSLIMTATLALHLFSRYGTQSGAMILYVILSSLVFLSIILAFAAPDLAIHSDAHAGNWRGIFVHKNVAGNVTVWLVALALYLASIKKLTPGVAVLSLIMAFGFIFMTGSKTSIVVAAIALATFVWAVILRNSIRLAAIIGIIIFLTGGLMALTLLFAPEVVTSVLGRDATFTGRSFIWDELIVLFERTPLLGYGYSALWSTTYGPLHRFIEYWQIAAGHNSYLDILVDTGLVGLSLYIAIMLNTLRKAWILTRFGDWPVGALGLTMIAIITALSFFESIIPSGHKIHWFLLVFIMISVDSAYRNLRKAKAENEAYIPQTMSK